MDCLLFGLEKKSSAPVLAGVDGVSPFIAINEQL